MNETTLQRATGKRVGLNMVCGIAEHLISGGIALLLTPFLIDRLGLELYGLYPIVLEFAALFSVLFGIVNSTSGKYIAVEEERGNTELAHKYFSSAFFANAGLGVLLLLPMGVLVAFSDKLLTLPRGAAEELKIFMILVFSSVVLDALSSAFECVYYITNRLDLRAGQRLFAAVIKAVSLALLLGIFEPSLTGVGVAILVSGAAGSFAQIFVAKKLVPDFRVSIEDFSFHSAKRLASSGLWYSFNRAGAFMMGGAMLVAVNSAFSPSVSGQYSLAFVFVNALGGIVTALAAVFVPVSAKCFARGERKRLRDSLAKDEKLIGLFAVVFVSVAAAFCRSFFELWVGGETSLLLVALTRILLLPILSLACATPIINVGMVMDRTRRLSLAFIGGGGLSLAAAVFCAEFTGLGVLGVAAVSCASQVFWYSVAVPMFAGRVLAASPKMFYIPILRVFLAAAVSLAVCLSVEAVCTVESWFGLAVAAGCGATMSLVISFCILFAPKRLTKSPF